MNPSMCVCVCLNMHLKTQRLSQEAYTRNSQQNLSLEKGREMGVWGTEIGKRAFCPVPIAPTHSAKVCIIWSKKLIP